jgi:hypothetical protein
MNVVMNLWVPWNVGDLLTSWVSDSFLWWTLFCVCACVHAYLHRRGVEEEDIKKLISAVLYASHWTASSSSEWRSKKIGDLWSYSAFYLPFWVFIYCRGIFDKKGMIFMDCCNNRYFLISITCTLNVGNCIVCWNVGRTLTYNTVQTHTPLLYFRAVIPNRGSAVPWGTANTS